MAYFNVHQLAFFNSSYIKEEEQQKLDTLLAVLEESGVAEIIKKETEKDRSKGGRIGVNPYRLYASILFAFSNHSGTLRKIEESLNYDIRYMYLMENQKASHVTISEFLNNVVVKHHRELYSRIVKTILDKYNINIEDCFLDGTKMEANANKYKFVWKPVFYHKRLNENILKIACKWGLKEKKDSTYISKELANMLVDFETKIRKMGLEIAAGKGHRQDPMVKDYFILTKLFLKTLEYEEKEDICGPNRNSYYKTDKDATAMCLKEDYYSGLGGNMHAAYSLQILVSKGFILDYYVCQERTDFKTLIPFLEKFKEDYGFYPKRLCADSGYGSFSNYEYLEKNKIENYVKHSLWRKMVSGSYVDMFQFDENGILTCLNGKTAEIYLTTRHAKTKGGNFYKIVGCKGCMYKDYCFKNVKDKDSEERIFETSFKLFQFRETANKNLLSPKGIEMRVNRSSQVEGAFGIIKQNMGYERVRRRSLEKVEYEISLVCLGVVIRKLFTLVEGKGKLDYWKAPEGLTAEIPKPYSLKKLCRAQPKGKNKELVSSYKKKGR